MKKVVFLLAMLFIAFILSCNQVASNQSKNEKEQKQQQKQNTKIIKFKTFSYIDSKGTGAEAFKMLIPTDWKFEGGINWVLDNPGMPANAAFKVTSPDNRTEFEVFPNQPFFWTNNRMLLSTFPIGTRYFGNEVKPMVSSSEALRSIILTRFRNKFPDLKIIETKNLPELAKALSGGGQSQQGITTTADAARIKIEYKLNGVPTEEEIYAMVESFSFGLQSMTGYITNTNWYVDYIFSFKSEKGKLEGNSKIFQTIVYSFKKNPIWFSKYNQVVEYLIKSQIQQIHNTGQLSRIISQTSNEISDMMMDSYNKREAVNDKISENFSNYIRGVEVYNDPSDNKTVELPSGYNNAWINKNGEYIVTDNPNYNPNVETNQSWEQLEKKK
jgi:hypothetical protein